MTHRQPLRVALLSLAVVVVVSGFSPAPHRSPPVFSADPATTTGGSEQVCPPRRRHPRLPCRTDPSHLRPRTRVPRRVRTRHSSRRRRRGNSVAPTPTSRSCSPPMSAKRTGASATTRKATDSRTSSPRGRRSCPSGGRGTRSPFVFDLSRPIPSRRCRRAARVLERSATSTVLRGTRTSRPTTRSCTRTSGRGSTWCFAGGEVTSSTSSASHPVPTLRRSASRTTAWEASRSDGGVTFRSTLRSGRFGTPDRRAGSRSTATASPSRADTCSTAQARARSDSRSGRSIGAMRSSSTPARAIRRSWVAPRTTSASTSPSTDEERVRHGPNHLGGLSRNSRTDRTGARRRSRRLHRQARPFRLEGGLRDVSGRKPSGGRIVHRG